MMKCARCGGKGQVTCRYCDGKGFTTKSNLARTVLLSLPMLNEKHTCSMCSGSGKIKCSSCGGTGKNSGWHY
ncbi:MAG: hypothetical protein HFJ35_07515 [Clostridia bacterium]|nr:hypothetical protein [Clostridia bacterium]